MVLGPMLGWVGYYASIYALKERICEHHLQQVGRDQWRDRPPSDDFTGRTGRRKEGVGRRGRGGNTTVKGRITPGSPNDARELLHALSMPAKGVTVLCVDPPSSRNGAEFLSEALKGRAATVFIDVASGF
ncbi:unnamed protein product, partial [Choristocarpus tenellus]